MSATRILRAGINTITVTSSNTTLVPNANINVGGTGTNTISNSTNGNQTLVITPAANQFGTTTITLTATDMVNGTTQTMTDTFVLTVNPVADTPSRDKRNYFDQHADERLDW